MKILYIGSVQFSKDMLIKLLRFKAEIAGIITTQKAGINTDFADLSSIARKFGIPLRRVADINTKDTAAWIKALGADIIFCFGFSQMLKRDILHSVPMGVIGFHPARLPQNRGRHPIVWALALGLGETASTFFFIDKGADSGDILSQRVLKISYGDDARTLYAKVTKTAARQIEELLPRLITGTASRLPQDRRKTNYWRRRYKEDGMIDFRMTSRAIYNLVRALTRPYIGAHLVHKGREIKVWRAKEVKVRSENIEPGRVLKVMGRKLLIKCYDNAIMLTEHDFDKLPERGECIR